MLLNTITNAILSMMTALSVISGNSALSPPMSREPVSMTRVAFVVGEGFASRHSTYDVCASGPWSTPPAIADHEPLSVRVSCGSGTRISYILAGLDWAASLNDSEATVMMPDQYRGHPLVEERLEAMRSAGMDVSEAPLPVRVQDGAPLMWIVVAVVGVAAMSALLLMTTFAEPDKERVRRVVPPRRWSGEATRPRLLY